MPVFGLNQGVMPIMGYNYGARNYRRLCSTYKLALLFAFILLGAGALLFRSAVAYVRSVCPEPCRMELNVNRHNRALHFYERMGMRKLREGDFPIGGGYWMNDYIMGLEIAGTDTDDRPGADGQRR